MVENQMKINTIHKFPLRLVDEQTILLPRGAQILSVGFQYSELQLWTLVDKTEMEKEPRRIAVWGTGEVFVGDPGRFLGTVFLTVAGEVYHVFETTAGE